MSSVPIGALMPALLVPAISKARREEEKQKVKANWIKHQAGTLQPYIWYECSNCGETKRCKMNKCYHCGAVMLNYKD